MARASCFLLMVAACSTPPPSSPAPQPPSAAPLAVEAPPAKAASELPDADHDSVPDLCDHCPGQPGINRVDHPYGRGCPWIDSFVDSGAFLRDVLVEFPKGSAVLSKSAEDRIRAFAPQLIGRKDGLRFFVIGHVSNDEIGDAGLGRRRADAVVAALAAAGVDEGLLMPVDAETASPVFDAAGKEMAAKSRRVIFDVSRNHVRQRAWNAERRSVEPVVLGELPTCPPELHAP